MNSERLYQKLIATARKDVPSDRVPVAFEQRLMAHIRRAPSEDATIFWAAGLWRAVLPSMALLGIAGALHFQNPADIDGVADIGSGSDELESVMVGSLESVEPW